MQCYTFNRATVGTPNIAVHVAMYRDIGRLHSVRGA